jgi:SAM-dependent methyltransferase
LNKFASQSATPESYDPAYFAPLFAIEDQHFWFRARNKVIATLVRQITSGLATGYRVLEVGCGTGNVLRVLDDVCSRGSVVGMDLLPEGLQYARRRTACHLVQGDVQNPPFAVQFSLIGLFDVLEHLPDDIQILRALHAMLSPGGFLLLTVPAHPSLWSYFDEASRHCRRYTLSELEGKLLQTGYRIEYLTQYMLSIFPVVWVGRRLATLFNRQSASDPSKVHNLAASELQVTPVVNGLLTHLLGLESHLIARHRRLPIGTSCIVIARKD